MKDATIFDTLKQAVADGKLLESSLENIELLTALHHVGEGLYSQLFESGHDDILTQAGRISRKSEKNNRYFIRVPKIWDTRIYDFGFTIYELRISG